jgi:hypothetical protein
MCGQGESGWEMSVLGIEVALYGSIHLMIEMAIKVPFSAA